MCSKRENIEIVNNFRIYGDNIVECFRVINIIRNNLYFSGEISVNFDNTSSVKVTFLENSILTEKYYFELIPGFDKSSKKRWKDNILNYLKDSGGDLNETADAIITKINKDQSEQFVLIIEFSSALMAGNQAWQRSGRAYSAGKTKIPYLYIVDFTRYELDSRTREKKALRFPNSIVPYSYISYSDILNTTVMQAYFQSEEFDSNDPMFNSTDFNNIFSDHEISNYLSNLFLSKPIKDNVNNLKMKNLEMVYFLADKQNDSSSFSKEQIKKLNTKSLFNSIVSISDIKFKKIIAEKSINGKIKELNQLISDNSKGIFSASLPFGIIPKKNMKTFIEGLEKLFVFNNTLLNKLKNSNEIIVTLIKGFKPGGDDNRPDRGILPLLRMLFGEEITILTVIYGPILEVNYNLLKKNQEALANKNGLWQTIIYMSDFLLVDSPIIKSKTLTSTQELFNLQHNKFKLRDTKLTKFKKIDVSPVTFREDDVDTLLYTLFTYNVNDAFVGLCNPPGGDWSGFSIIDENIEKRWLSLPRVSENQYKRPDHVVQFFNFNKPILFNIESKDKAGDLEVNIGERLNGYVLWLMGFTPNVEKKDNIWTISNSKITLDKYLLVSCGSFIDLNNSDHSSKFHNWNCDVILSFTPVNFKYWDITIFHNNKDETMYVIDKIKNSFQTSNIIKKIKLVNVSPA